ncbi:oocyte zinc finger protein XlCOF6-like protein, partial [Leptotrombidium deliense]
FPAAAHILWVHKKEKRFDCEFCDKKYTTSDNLYRHFKKVHVIATNFKEEKTEKMNMDKKLSNIAKKDEVDEVWEQVSLKCSEVRENIILEFNDHIETIVVNGVTRFRCSFCGISFSYNSRAAKHILLVHKNEKRFSCEFCDKKYTNTTNLHRHFREVHVKLMNFDKDITELTNIEKINNSEGIYKNSSDNIKNENDTFNNMTDICEIDLNCKQCQITFTCQSLKQFHVLKVHNQNHIDHNLIFLLKHEECDRVQNNAMKHQNFVINNHLHKLNILKFLLQYCVFFLQNE